MDYIELFSMTYNDNKEDVDFNLNKCLQFGSGLYFYQLDSNSKEEILKGKNAYKYNFYFEVFKEYGGNIRIFDDPDKEWFEFISSNLVMGDNLGSEYDLIIGPAFNKDYLPELSFESAILGKPLAMEFENAVLKSTVFVIKNEMALSYLKYIGSDING